MDNIGKAAEKAAARFLKEKGYKIIKTNYKCPFGEIDLIAEKAGGLFFIEVKFRNSADFGRPEEFVNKKKQHKIVKSALYYLKNEKPKKSNMQFDILAFISSLDKAEHIKAAYEASSLYKY